MSRPGCGREYPIRSDDYDADERRNRRRRQARTPRPPRAVATKTIADGSGVIIVHAAFVSIQSCVPNGANENVAIPTPDPSMLDTPGMQFWQEPNPT